MSIPQVRPAMILLLGVAVLALVTAVHEAGHWLAVVAKRGEVIRIQIGRGLSLWRRDIDGMLVTVSLLPFGGRIDYDGVRPGTAQMVVAISGSLANLVFSFILFSLALWLAGGEGLPGAENVEGIAHYGVASAAGWFWMVPEAIAELVADGMAIELNRSIRMGVNLLVTREAGSLAYAAAALSAIWAALNLIPIPVLRTDGWMVASALWGMLTRVVEGRIRPGR